MFLWASYKKKYEKKYEKKIFLAFLKSRKKGVGSGSINQRYGSGDPDPDPQRNVTDPYTDDFQILVTKLVFRKKFNQGGTQNITSCKIVYKFAKKIQFRETFYICNFSEKI